MPHKMIDGKRTYVEHQEKNLRAEMPEYEASIGDIEAEFGVSIRMGNYTAGLENGKPIDYYQAFCVSPFPAANPLFQGLQTWGGGYTPREALLKLRDRLNEQRMGQEGR